MSQRNSHPRSLRTPRFRRVASWGARCFLITAILAQAVYLARRPLLEPWLLATAQRELSEALEGTVELGALRGNWITSLELEAVQVSRGGFSMENGRIRARIEPWRLLGAAPLTALRRIQVAADRIELDLEVLDGFAASDPSTDEERDFSIQALADVAPEGVTAVCRELVLRGDAQQRSGPATVRAEARAEDRRVIEVEAPGLALHGHLTAEGELSCRVSCAATGTWVALLGGGTAIRDGHLRARATARFEPELRARVHAEVSDASVDGRHVPWIEAKAEIAGEHLRHGRLQLRTAGARVDFRGVTCDFARSPTEALRSLRGTALVDIHDVAPFANLLPAEIVQLEPVIAADLRFGEERWDVEGMRVATVVGDRLSGRGHFDLSAFDAIETLGSLEVEQIAAHSRMRITFDELIAAPWARALALDDVEGELRGHATWGGSERRLAVELRGEVRRDHLGGSITLAMQSDDRGTRLGRLEAKGSGGELSAHATAPALTPFGLLEAPARALDQEFTGGATLILGDLAELQLARLGAPDVAGRLTAIFHADGTLRAPRPRADITLEQVAVYAADAPPVEQLSGQLAVAATGVELDDVRVVVAGRPLRLSGAISRDAGALTTEDLTLFQQPAGSLQLRGRIDTNDPTELTRALLSRSALQAQVVDFDVGPWLSLAGHAGLRSSMSGLVSWQGDGAPRCEVTLSGSVTGLTPQPSDRLEIELALASDTDGTRLRKLDVRGGGATLSAQLLAPELALQGLLLAPAAVDEQAIEASVALTVTDLGRLGLERLGAPELAGGLRATLDAEGTWRALRPRGEITFERIDLRDSGTPRVEGVTGTLVLEPSRLELVDLHATLDGAPLRIGGVIARAERELTIEGLTISQQPAGTVQLSGRIGTADPSQLVSALLTRSQLDAELINLDLEPWLARAGHAGAAGSIGGHLSWRTGSAPRLAGTLNGTVTGVIPEQSSALAFELALRGDGDGLAVERLNARSGPMTVSGAAALGAVTPADLLRRPERLWSAPLSVDCEVTGLPLGQIEASKLGLTDLGGRASGQLSVSGTLAEPNPVLVLQIAEGFARMPRGSRFEDIAGRIRITPHRVAFEGLRATVGAGPLQIDGAFETPERLPDGWRQGQLDLTLSGHDVLLYRGDGVKLRGDLELTASGPPDEVEVLGKVSLHSSKVVSRLPYLEYSRVGGVAVREGLGIEGIDLGAGVRVRLDIDVVTAEPINVKTNVLRGQVTASLKLTGPLSAPTLDGTVSGADAVLILPGCRFRAASLLLTYEPDTPRFPTISLVATSRRHGYDLQMSVRGRYDRPEILLTSNPPLPAEDLVVLVTTGARPESLRQGGAQAVGTTIGAHLVDELAQYFFGSEATEAHESFADRFTLETGTEISADGTESVVVEFRVVDRFHLQAERDVYEFVNFGVLYRIRFK